MFISLMGLVFTSMSLTMFALMFFKRNSYHLALAEIIKIHNPIEEDGFHYPTLKFKTKNYQDIVITLKDYPQNMKNYNVGDRINILYDKSHPESVIPEMKELFKITLPIFLLGIAILAFRILPFFLG